MHIRSVPNQVHQSWQPHERTAGRGRLPPGQVVVDQLPIHPVDSVMVWDPDTWSLEVVGQVATMRKYSWDAFAQLPSRSIVADFHCVNGLSCLGLSWHGVPFEFFYHAVQPESSVGYVTFEGEDGVMAVFPIEQCLEDRALLAHTLNGQPLEPKFGGPVRLIQPEAYCWKNVQSLRRIYFTHDPILSDQQPYRFHPSANPWAEERYRS